MYSLEIKKNPFLNYISPSITTFFSSTTLRIYVKDHYKPSARAYTVTNIPKRKAGRKHTATAMTLTITILTTEQQKKKSTTGLKKNLQKEERKKIVV
jgi:hypothetical protein